MRNKRFQVSAGYSLLEMMVMISVFSVVMTATLSWIHASMKFSSAVKNRAFVHQQLNRLSEDLRTRIALADSIKVDGNTLELSSEGTRTSYTIKESLLERVQKQNSADDSSADSIESFHIGSDVDASWGTEELPNWVSLTIKQKPVVAISDESSSSIGSLETPKLEWHLRAGPRKVAQ